MAQLDRLAGAGVDGAGVVAGKDGLADDVGNDQEDDLGLVGDLVAGGEEVLEERQFAEAGGSGDGEAVLLGDDAGEEAGFAVLEGDDLLGGALADDGLLNAADGDGLAWESTSIFILRVISRS